MKSLLLSLFPLVLAAQSTACAAPSSDSAETSDDDEIIGGVDAKSARLDAIGVLAFGEKGGNEVRPFCSGTLIGPDLVLTAKHCGVEPASADQPASRLIDLGDVYFAVGADAAQARGMTKAVHLDVCGIDTGGYVGIGCDVAIYRLTAPVRDVKPLRIARTSMGQSLVGRRLAAVGYGFQDQAGSKLGTRRSGSLTVRAVRGAPLPTLFQTSAAFEDAVRRQEVAATVDANKAALEELFRRELLEGYEAFAGGAPGDAQICFGDSGGPLLKKEGSELVVQGVASATGMSGESVPCGFGVVYASLGPKVQELVAAAASDPCAGIPDAGRCDGDLAVRCTRAGEGERRVTRTDCAELAQRCLPGPDEVQCND